MEQLIRHIHLGCSWTTESPVILEDFKPNSHRLQLVRTSHRIGHWCLPKRQLLWAWHWNSLLYADLSHQKNKNRKNYLAPTDMQSKLFPLWWMQESMVVTPKLMKANSSFPPHQLAVGSQPSHTGFHGSSQWMRSFAHTQYFLWSQSFNRLHVCLMLHLQSCQPQPLKNCKTFSRTIPLGLTDLWLWASLYCQAFHH